MSYALREPRYDYYGNDNARLLSFGDRWDKEQNRAYIVVPTAHQFDRYDLMGLATGKYLAVIIKGYIDDYTINQFERRYIDPARAESRAKNYPHEIVEGGKFQELDYGVLRLGNPFNRVISSPDDDTRFEREYEYFASARPTMNEMNGATPDGSPFNKFFNHMRTRNIWPGGVEIAQWEGRKMFAGIVRLTKPNAAPLEEAPHIDSLDADFNTMAQLSVNAFIETPKQGGELVVYELPPFSHREAKEIEGDPERWNSLLAAAWKRSIKPEAGDLIIINSRRAHAVATYQSDRIERISQASFMGVRSFDEPIVFWS